MRNRVLAIFTTWPFVLALVVLLVNDGLLKQAYPGLITGKLSDFAGIALVPLAVRRVPAARSHYLPRVLRRLPVVEESCFERIHHIHGNDVQPLRIGRTVDYGDLLALAILPACAKIASGLRSLVNSAALRRWVLPPVFAATLFGVMATSTPIYRKDFDVRAVESSAPFPRDEIVDSIKKIAKARGLKPSEPNPPHWEGAFKGRGIFLLTRSASKTKSPSVSRSTRECLVAARYARPRRCAMKSRGR